MKKKMFFIDLDGTTLRDDKTIPEENIRAIEKVVDAGHHVSIATGRALVSAKMMAERLGMLRKGCFLISFNGAIIYDLSDMSRLRDLRLPDEYAAYLCREAQKSHLYIQAYNETKVLAPYLCPELLYYSGRNVVDYEIVPDLYQQKVFHTPKVLMVSTEDPSALEKFRQDHLSWQEGRCVSFFSCPQYLEYCPAEATKAEGIAFFEKRLGIAHEDTVAVGDEDNDAAMIRYAGTGVVMKNGNEAVKPFADYITERDNNHGGLAEVLCRYAGVDVNLPQ